MLTHDQVKKLIIENTTNDRKGMENALEVLTDCTAAIFMTCIDKGMDVSENIGRLLVSVQKHMEKLQEEGNTVQ